MNKCKASVTENLDLKKAISERKNVSNTWHMGVIVFCNFSKTNILTEKNRYKHLFKKSLYVFWEIFFWQVWSLVYKYYIVFIKYNDKLI